MRALRAAAAAAALSGIPSTAHALVTGRDPLEATLAAGSIVLPGETRRLPLLVAGGTAHLAISLGWTVVLERAGVRGATRGALAGLAIAALDLGVVGRRIPRIQTLPLLPQLADHAAFGAIAARLLRPRLPPERSGYVSFNPQRREQWTGNRARRQVTSGRSQSRR